MDKGQDFIAEESYSLSTLLTGLPGAGDGPMRVEDFVAHFGPRAFGALLFVFSIPNLLPLPPGSSTFLSLPLLLLAPQLALGARKPWLPRALRDKTIDRNLLQSIAQRATPWVRRAERLTTPRLTFLFGRPGDVVIGAVCTLLAAVLILPIPLGNMLPAAAIAALSLSLIQRDGLLTLIGYATAAVSAGVLVLSGRLVLGAFDRLGAMTGLW